MRTISLRTITIRAVAAVFATAVTAAFLVLPGAAPASAAESCRSIGVTSRIDASTVGIGLGEAYNVQFIQRACWDGNTVRWTSSPDFRINDNNGFGAPESSTTACTYTAQTPVNTAQSVVRTTCQVTVKNTGINTRLLFAPANRIDDNSNFSLFSFESTSRSYSLSVDRFGCVNVSGVGQGSACQ